jgi:RNA polymerase sigma-B factor
MVLNPRQRHEQRRCLPPGTKERNQKVLQHLGLAHCVATRQRQRGPEERDDLLQEACLGLIQGVENLNPSRGFRPSSYLMSRANGQVLHYRRDRSRMVRIPWRLQDLFVSGQRLQEKRTQRGLPPLNNRSIAAHLKVSPQRWLDACAAEVSKKKDSNRNSGLAVPSRPQSRSSSGVASRGFASAGTSPSIVTEATLD